MGIQGSSTVSGLTAPSLTTDSRAVWMDPRRLLDSPRCSHVPEIINKAAMNTCLRVFVWTCLQLFGVGTREHNCWTERVYVLLEETTQPPPPRSHLPCRPLQQRREELLLLSCLSASEPGLPERRAAVSLRCHLRLLTTSGAELHVRR